MLTIFTKPMNLPHMILILNYDLNISHYFSVNSETSLNKSYAILYLKNSKVPNNKKT